ncbi:hypothetical protein LOAG_09114 [Loa loa]|uniref:Uncharacterized protein n=1 Tax=Loa loa TaxID=7209 RepID=A0A1S0TT12_LOALO|nr:hypothetical protein LOAG_09114 [Loa loa]EFO19380.1 hypothetical protein LOAG_09114 [Loa loa]
MTEVSASALRFGKSKWCVIGVEIDEKQLDCLSLLPIIRYFVKRRTLEVVMPEFCIYKSALSALKLLILVPHMVHDGLLALIVTRDACGSVIIQKSTGPKYPRFVTKRVYMSEEVGVLYSKHSSTRNTSETVQAL